MVQSARHSLADGWIRDGKASAAGPRSWCPRIGDTVGAGRYILSFFLAGLIGLGIQYFLREKGWTAVGINAVIFVIILVFVIATA